MRRLLLLAVLPLLGSCATGRPDSPALHLSPDLRTIAFFAEPAFYGAAPRSVETVSRDTGKITSYCLPGLDTGKSISFFDNRVYVSSFGTNAVGFILDNGKWLKQPYVDGIWYPTFAGRYNGQPAVFRGGYKTDVYALKDFSRLGTLDAHFRGIGDGYSLRYSWPPDRTPTQLTSVGWLYQTAANADGSTTWKDCPISSIDLLDPDLKPLMHLDAPTPAQRLFSDGEAQISPDHKTLMLAPEHHGMMGGSGNADTLWSWHYSGFTLYEIPTGRILYSSDALTPPRRAGRPDSAEMRGTPVTPLTLTNDGIYAIEETIPPDPAATNAALPHRKPGRSDHQFWLTRYRVSDGRQHLLELPLPAGDFVPPFSTVASPAGRLMIIHSMEPRPHLLEVPLKADVTTEDIRTLDLLQSQ